MKYILISEEIKYTNYGLIAKALYENPECKLEKPHKIVFFNRWPPIEFEADYVEVELDGVYAYPNGTRTRAIRVLCPKDKEGNYTYGSPEEVIRHQKSILRKVSN